MILFLYDSFEQFNFLDNFLEFILFYFVDIVKKYSTSVRNNQITFNHDREDIKR